MSQNTSPGNRSVGAEQLRLQATKHDSIKSNGNTEWKTWGPYVSERAWGTVREDYSEHGEAWDYFPHDHARSRAFRWSEDGLGALCDIQQRLCFAFAFWNGNDPILKERIFGLNGNEGNHGEDAKEYWWYLDSTPTHSWMQWRYMYPHNAFPYNDLIETNRHRSKGEPEYELNDTGIFDENRYFDITVDYAKAAADDYCIEMRIRNAGPDSATITVLPTIWFRNTWSWGLPNSAKPSVTVSHRENGVALDARHESLGSMSLVSDDVSATALLCENESNGPRLWSTEAPSRAPKDGINDHVINGLDSINHDGVGTKGSLNHRITIEPGQTHTLHLRLSASGAPIDATFHQALHDRHVEADEFYAAITPPTTTAQDAMILRQAFAGMMWCKQWFHFDVDQWLNGDPNGPKPSATRATARNSAWRHLNNSDVISMPDAWEYPWYAAWDLAFHCVPIAHIDPEFAKQQLVLLCREWYMHPNGQLPAYEWAFGDVNPPVHAWAALQVFHLDGGTDFEFLERILHKLLINFTWWVNRKDADGNNVFEGGFLGLDNIGPIDRSAQLPVDGRLEQSDGTAWMAMYCLDLLEMSLVLAQHDNAYEDLATKFFEHFTYIADAMYTRGLWDEEDGFYYDVLQVTGGERLPLRVRSMVGILPLVATTTLGTETLSKLPSFAAHVKWFIEHKPQLAQHANSMHQRPDGNGQLLSIVSPDRLRRVLSYLLDENEFLSRYGIRALSAVHRDHPFSLQLAGMNFAVGYEPGESHSGLFGGNSNWRGPIWFPVNYLVIEAIRRFSNFFGGDFTIEYPTGSATLVTLDEVANLLSNRLIDLFRNDENLKRACFGNDERFQTDPEWHDNILFNEYFHGDTGAGLGASHQTGWTGLVADLIMRSPAKPTS